MLNAKPLSIDGVVLISPTRFEDGRGYFEETFNLRDFTDAIGIEVEFVQDNESRTKQKGTIRGLHYQVPPAAQGKLVRVLSGKVLDVVVDIRLSSPTYGQHLTVELCPERGQQLWIPEGMAHGFCTLESDTVLNYKVTNFYDPTADRTLTWDDPAIGIEWPVGRDDVILSDKDAEALCLIQLKQAGDVFE